MYGPAASVYPSPSVMPFRRTLILAILLLPLGLRAALTPGAFNALTHTDPGTGFTIPYQLYVPVGYTPGTSTRYPLVVSLHGAGERRSTNSSPAPFFPTSAFVTAEAQAYARSFVLHPWCPTGQQWVNQEFGGGTYNQTSMPISGPLGAVSSLLDSLLATEPAIHPDRVVITGLSMGGYGTLDLASRRPGLFAAALAVCGGGPAPQAAQGIYGQLPLWLFHGDADNIVPVSGSRDMVDALLTAGARVRYREYPGAGHDTWTPTYTDQNVVRWLLSRVRGGPVPGNQAPSLAVGSANVTVDLPTFTYTPPTVLSDPDGGPSSTHVWWYPVAGPGRPLFTPQDGGFATALFPRVGTYRLRATADDGSAFVSREIVVQVRPPGGGAMPTLLGHWNFDEGSGLQVNDATGHSAPGQLITAGSWITDTPDGSPSALRFNSPGNVVRIPASPWLSPSNNRFSLTFWAKVTWDGFLFHQFGAWDLNTAGGLRLTFLGNGNGAWFQPGAPGGSAGRWTHVAFTYDGSVGRYYFNGVLAHTRDSEGLVLKASTSPLLIGGKTWNANRDDAEHIQGALDDVRLYDAPLSSSQILALMQPPASGFAGWISALPSPPPANLRGPTQDPDADGLPNLLEYALGGSPVSAASAPRPIVQLDTSGGASGRTLSLRYKRAISSGLNYVVTRSADLVSTHWIPLASPELFDAPSGLHYRSYELTPDSPRVFLRLEVSEP